MRNETANPRPTLLTVLKVNARLAAALPLLLIAALYLPVVEAFEAFNAFYGDGEEWRNMLDDNAVYLARQSVGVLTNVNLVTLVLASGAVLLARIGDADFYRSTWARSRTMSLLCLVAASACLLLLLVTVSIPHFTEFASSERGILSSTWRFSLLSLLIVWLLFVPLNFISLHRLSGRSR
jgi:hypothetical protein